MVKAVSHRETVPRFESWGEHPPIVARLRFPKGTIADGDAVTAAQLIIAWQWAVSSR